jgi:CcmD family protein
MVYLFIAFALIWAGTLAYLYRLASLRKQLEKRISCIETAATAGEFDNA